jgi:hypothetical protein
MSILALDLGAKTGWCFGSHPDRLTVKTIQLAKPSVIRKLGKEMRNYDPRIVSLYEEIAFLREPISHIVFEDVQFATTTYQVQLWASLRGAVWIGKHARINHQSLEIKGVPVGTIKKFATGNGAADKQAMRQSAEEKGLDCSGLDDNAIDAWHLWCYSWKELK